MQVKFVHSRQLGKQVYPKGVHEVPDEQAEHWFFKAMQKVGDIVVMPVEKPEEKVEAPSSQSADKLKAEHEAKVKAEAEAKAKSEQKPEVKGSSQPQKKG